MLSGPLYTLTTSEAVWWSRNIPAFLTFGSGALVVTCSLSLKFFDQGLWTPELFSATVFWLKGHTRHLSSSHYASFSGHVCFTPSPSIRKRSPGSCQMQKGYVFTYASTVIIITRNVAWFSDGHSFTVTLLWPFRYFFCAVDHFTADYSEQPGRGTLSLLSQLWKAMVLVQFVLLRFPLCSKSVIL